MSNVGEVIKERRLAKGMSKRALAEKAGISHSEVHRIENGERQNPSVPMLIALADALGIPQDDISYARRVQDRRGKHSTD